MPHLILQATADHIRRISGDSNPTQAIIELIWNSIDAEAGNIKVELGREPTLRSITEVVVTDTGHGITPEEVSTEFGRIGDSWKSRGNRRSKNNLRGVHGSKGMGRLRAFALGPEIRWVSTSRDTAGDRKTIQIDGSASTRNRFFWTEIESDAQEETGTVFTAFSTRPSLNSLDAPASQELIASAFAPTLLDDPDIKVTLYGTLLDPKSQIEHDKTYTETVQVSKENSVPVKVRIIEWKQGKHRQIYFGEMPGRATYVEDGRTIESQFPYSAYISWPGLEAQADLLALGRDGEPDPPYCPVYNYSSGSNRKALPGTASPKASRADQRMEVSGHLSVSRRASQ